MVLPVQWYPGLRFSKIRPRIVLRGVLGHEVGLEIHEIRKVADIDKRTRVILRNIHKELIRSNPDRPVQFNRDNYIVKASGPGLDNLRDVEDSYPGVLGALHLHVAVQEPDFKADYV